MKKELGATAIALIALALSGCIQEPWEEHPCKDEVCGNGNCVQYCGESSETCPIDCVVLPPVECSAATDCDGMVHIAVPGYWICEAEKCVWAQQQASGELSEICSGEELKQWVAGYSGPDVEMMEKLRVYCMSLGPDAEGCPIGLAQSTFMAIATGGFAECLTYCDIPGNAHGSGWFSVMYERTATGTEFPYFHPGIFERQC